MKVESRRGRHARDDSVTEHADVAIELVRGDGPLGTTVPIRSYVLGEVQGIAERISNVISRCETEADDHVRAELISHGVGLIRAWCESYVEQKVLGNAVSRLGWQINPKEAALITPERVARAERLSRIHEQLHQRIAAHPQPGELGHRTMSTSELKQIWDEAQAAVTSELGVPREATAASVVPETATFQGRG